jgi:hypothetical protein
VHGFIVTMRYDHPLEEEFEHLSKSGEFAFFVACSAVPDSEFSAPLCQRVPEHDDAMLGKPYGSLETSAPVVEGNQTPWGLPSARIGSNLVLGMSSGKKNIGPKARAP